MYGLVVNHSAAERLVPFDMPALRPTSRMSEMVQLGEPSCALSAANN